MNARHECSAWMLGMMRNDASCFLVFLLFLLHLLGSTTWSKDFHLETSWRRLRHLPHFPRCPMCTRWRGIVTSRATWSVQCLRSVEWSWFAKALRSKRRTHALLLLSPLAKPRCCRWSLTKRVNVKELMLISVEQCQIMSINVGTCSSKSKMLIHVTC